MERWKAAEDEEKVIQKEPPFYLVVEEELGLAHTHISTHADVNGL